MQIIAAQIDIDWEQRASNYQTVRRLLGDPRVKAGTMVVLPEMFASGFSMNLNMIAEDESRSTERFLIETAKQYGMFLTAGLVTRAASHKGLNQSLTVGPDGSILARYSKIHPFCIGGEQDHFEPGRATASFAWHGFTVAPFVCYDLRFPEIFRHAALQGADLFTVIANWPESRIRHWVTLLQARAIENQAYVIGVNRVGNDPTPLHYPGRSMIVDPVGQIIADAGSQEGLAIADLSVDTVREVRAKFPALNDIRREFLRE